jgi:hypothetical protein
MTILQRIAIFLTTLNAPHGVMKQTEAVYSLSDLELAEFGIKRQDAVRQIMINGNWS